MTKSHEYYMRAALGRAKTAAKHGETPVGAVIVKNGKIIAGGRNRREKAKNALCHAEISAINAACKKLGGWRLIGCDLYVTLEPCPMCAGAIVMSGLKDVVYGAADERAGCAGSVYALPEDPAFGAGIACSGGLLEGECKALLSAFFKTCRAE